VAEFKLRSTIPPEFVDAIETAQPGWLLAQLEQGSRWIDSRLRKRYPVPFAACPEIVKGWLVKLVTIRCYERRGFDPTDQSIQPSVQDAVDAKAEIAEAANSETGLFDLPLNDTTTATGASKGGPFSYSEQSPYVFADGQVTRGRNEDLNGSGTSG
jgi:hypothetical protein